MECSGILWYLQCRYLNNKRKKEKEQEKERKNRRKGDYRQYHFTLSKIIIVKPLFSDFFMEG